MSVFDLTRVWAALTGLILVAWYFIALAMGHPAPELVAMMAVTVGGFEIALFGQDVVKRRKSRG